MFHVNEQSTLTQSQLQTGSKLPWRDTAARLVMRYQTPSQVPSGSESLAHTHVDSWLQQCTASFQPKLRPIFHGILASLKHTYHLWQTTTQTMAHYLTNVDSDSWTFRLFSCLCTSQLSCICNCANTTNESWIPMFNSMNNNVFVIAYKMENI